MNNSAQELLKFIDQSPSAYHAVEQVKSTLDAHGFSELYEIGAWNLELGKKYYVTRAGGAIIAFTVPTEITDDTSLKIIGAHTDSPCLKIKNNPVSSKENYQLLNVEVYGGVLLTSWFDKDLYIGGRVIIENSHGKLVERLVKLPFKVRIPRLAIHLDRQVNNDGFKPNAQTEMFPVVGLGDNFNFESYLNTETGSKVLSWDLFLFDAEPCSFGGVSNEFIYAPRLDNLASVHASLSALKAANSDEHFLFGCYYNHEEIGSVSQSGADSNFMEATLKRVYSSLDKTDTDLLQTIAKSFFISADMAHAVHPNYSHKHDANNKPYMGRGPVIKGNANIRYATDAFSIAKFKQLCHEADVPYQDFHSRNDMGCGSTIGPMSSARLGIPTVDVGNPMLSMHSIREMAGSADHEMLIKVFEKFYR